MDRFKSTIFTCAPKVLDRFPVLFAYLYGSQASRVVHPFGDVDIVVFLTNDETLSTMS